MPDLRRAGEDIVARPLFEPTPVAELEVRAGVLLAQRRRRLTGLTVVAAIALVLALAGSVGLAATNGRKGTVASGVPSASTTTTTAAAAAGTTAVAAGETTTSVAGSTATTAKSTATTAKATATTAKKSATVAAPKGVTGGIANVQTNLLNVQATTTTAPSADIQPGGAITMLTAGEIAGFDPATIPNTSTDGLPAAAVFDTIVYSDSGTGTISAQIADSLSSTDAVTWVLKLRPNVKFSDGTAYDASAVRFNWLRLQDPTVHASQGALADQIQSMDVVDPVTLRITLRSKNAQFPVAVSLISFIGSPTAIQAKGAAFATSPVGAGPFLLRSWSKGSDMTLARNPGYWNPPKPYIDQLVLRPIADEAQRTSAFSNNQGNVIVVDAPQTADQLTKAGSSTVNKLVLNGGTVVLFNTTKAPFSDVRARQAVAAAIDLTDYSKTVDGGLVDPVDSLFRHDSPFYDSGLTQPSFNAAKAQQLFDQLAADRGVPLTFTITTSSAQTQTAAAQYVQSALNKYNNVKVSVQSEAPAAHAASCAAGTFDAACTTVNGFDDPEPLWTSMFRCNATPSPTGWCNTKFDGSVVDNQQTLDPNTRIADIKAAQTQFYAEVPALYLERRTVWVFTAPNIRDFRFANAGIPLIDRFWIQSKTSANTVPTTAPPPSTTTTTTRPTTTITTIPPTTVKPTTTTAKPTTTTAKPTTTTAKPTTTTTAVAPTTSAPVTTQVTVAPTTTTTTQQEVALPATPTSSEQKPLPVGLIILVVLLAIIFGVASTAAFMVWRQGRGW